MASFAPPPGPPPPSVPEGWKAVWNDQYHEWFFVNLHTKESTWTRPTAPALPPGDAPPSGAPPAYSGGPAAGDVKSGLHDAKRPIDGSAESDEALAHRLQEEENARASSSTAPAQAAAMGQAQDYYNNAGSSNPHLSPGGTQQRFGGRPDESYSPQQQQQKGGLFGKLMGKMSNSSSHQPQQGYQNQAYGQYPPQQGYYGGQGPMAPGYPPQQQYYGGGYAQPPPGRRPGGGMGGAGALALGGGAGLLGGMALGSAMSGGFGDGGDHGDYGGDGGDYGGGDYGGDGGGDFGGDGGGDFGGGGD